MNFYDAFDGSLKGTQKESILYCCSSPKSGLFATTGFGKTIITAGVYSVLYLTNKPRKFIVLCEKSCRSQWVNELNQFVIPLKNPECNEKVFIQTKDTKASRMEAISEFKDALNGVLILSYYSCIGDFELLDGLTSNQDISLIFDEAQILSNENKTSKNAAVLIEQSKRCHLLTATPISSSPIQFYRLMSLLGCELGTKYEFIERYCNYEIVDVILINNKPIKKKDFASWSFYDNVRRKFSNFVHDSIIMNKALKDNEPIPPEVGKPVFHKFTPHGMRKPYMVKMFHIKQPISFRKDRMEYLSKLTKPFYYRNKYEALHDAELSYHKIPIILNPQHRQKYQQVKDRIEKELPLTVFQDLALAVNDPSLLGSIERGTDISPKINELLTLLEYHISSGDKVLIYTRRIRWSKMIFGIVSQRFASLYISGDTSAEDRAELNDKLENGGISVIVGTEVIKRGLNLQNANVTILAEMPLTAGDIDQLFGRTDRRKQEAETVHYYYLVTEDTFEEELFERVQERQASKDLLFSEKSNYFKLTQTYAKELVLSR